MRTLSAKDARYGFGRPVDFARAAPAIVARQGRPGRRGGLGGRMRAAEDARRGWPGDGGTKVTTNGTGSH